MINLKGKYSTREVWYNGQLITPIYSQEIINHSPDGFNWGYAGSGPAQLSLAIAYIIFNDRQLAMLYYGRLKNDIISKLPQDDFDINFDLNFNFVV